MSRVALLAIAALVVAGCAKKADESDVPADTAQVAPAPPAPAPLSLADLKGTWAMTVMPVDKDTVLTSYHLYASDDTAAWKLKFDNRADTIKVNVVALGGDSVAVRFGPYSSALRKNVKVVSESVERLQNGKLVGSITAHYSVTTADSLVHLRSEGTREQ